MTKKEKLNHKLYCITGEEHSMGRSTVEVVKEMLESGVKIIQYREKHKTERQKYIDCTRLRQLTKSVGAIFIVNDDRDIALAVKADGIHIGQDDMPIEAVRSLVGKTVIIGLSTHSPEQARDALERGADYIGVGPIYSTKTKENVCAPTGIEYLDYIVDNINIPFVAIGGIKLHNIDEVMNHGAKCLALVTEIVGAPNIKNRIAEIMEKATFL
jgi:thiamine-phosphate pyrophosphorylase